jgi:hypothetical protein
MILFFGPQGANPGRSRPKGFQAALFLVLAWALAARTQARPRNFTAIKLVLDDTDPEYIKLKAVAK